MRTINCQDNHAGGLKEEENKVCERLYWYLPIVMGIFAHRIEQLCPTLWAKLPNAMGRVHSCT